MIIANKYGIKFASLLWKRMKHKVNNSLSLKRNIRYEKSKATLHG